MPATLLLCLCCTLKIAAQNEEQPAAPGMMSFPERPFAWQGTETPLIGSPEVVWDLTLNFFFDNREFESSKFNWSQTLFGIRVAPEIGIRWQNRHSIMGGVNMLGNFGDKPFFERGNEIFAYYRYDSKKFRAWAGIIPRKNVIGDYPRVFFSDSIIYYAPNLGGLTLQYVGDRGFVEFNADWNSMITNERREKFILFSAARLNLGVRKLFYIGYHASMYHHAGTHLDDGVVDNILLHPHVGMDLTRIVPMDVLSLQVGWLQSFQNDRKYVGQYVKPAGVQIETKVEKWKLGVFNTLYLGDNLMPYFVGAPELDYGPGLYWGDPFYRTTYGIYNRLELYWQPVHNRMMNLRVASVHHYDGQVWGWQQMVVFWVYLGQQRLVNR